MATDWLKVVAGKNLWTLSILSASLWSASHLCFLSLESLPTMAQTARRTLLQPARLPPHPRTACKRSATCWAHKPTLALPPNCSFMAKAQASTVFILLR